MPTKRESLKIPKGWILVPKKPTQQMFDAGDNTFESCYTGTPTSTPDRVWAAMVKAAPKPPNGEVRGASRLAGEASSAEGATSTVVLEVESPGKETK